MAVVAVVVVVVVVISRATFATARKPPASLVDRLQRPRGLLPVAMPLSLRLLLVLLLVLLMLLRLLPLLPVRAPCPLLPVSMSLRRCMLV